MQTSLLVDCDFSSGRLISIRLHLTGLKCTLGFTEMPDLLVQAALGHLVKSEVGHAIQSNGYWDHTFSVEDL